MSDAKIQELELRIEQLEKALIALATGEPIGSDKAGRPFAVRQQHVTGLSRNMRDDGI